MQVFCTVRTEICAVTELVTSNLSTFTTMKFQFFTLLCCCGLLFFAACEKEQLLTTDSQLPASEEITPDVVDEPITFEATVEDGMLSFATIKAFDQAVELAAEGSDEALNTYYAEIGYTSMYQYYTSVRDRLEANEAPFAEQMTSAERDYFLGEEEGDFLPPMKSKVFSQIINKEGLVLIADQLHFFSSEAHVLVADKDKSILPNVLRTKESDLENGVIYTLQDELVQPDARNEFKPCPLFQIKFDDEDQSGGQRIRVRLEGVTFTSNYTSNLVQYHWKLTAELNNTRRRRFNWIRTWKTSQFEIVPSNSGSMSSFDYATRLTTGNVGGGIILQGLSVKPFGWIMGANDVADYEIKGFLIKIGGS